MVLVTKAIKHQLVVPDWPQFVAQLDKIVANVKNSSGDGKVADYIPELATADPGWYGVSVCSIGTFALIFRFTGSLFFCRRSTSLMG